MNRVEFVKMFGKDAVPEPSEMPEYCEHSSNEDECSCNEDEGECDPECPVCASDGINPIMAEFLYCLSRAQHILEEHSEVMDLGKQAELWIAIGSQHRKMLEN